MLESRWAAGWEPWCLVTPCPPTICGSSRSLCPCPWEPCSAQEEARKCGHSAGDGDGEQDSHSGLA